MLFILAFLLKNSPSPTASRPSAKMSYFLIYLLSVNDGQKIQQRYVFTFELFCFFFIFRIS